MTQFYREIAKAVLGGIAGAAFMAFLHGDYGVADVATVSQGYQWGFAEWFMAAFSGSLIASLYKLSYERGERE